MDDVELNNLSSDPRYAGKLRKTSKKDKEAFKSLFEGLNEEKRYLDKRGRPWPKKPVTYAKQLIKKHTTTEADTESDEHSSESEDSELSSSSELFKERLADLQDADWSALIKNAKETETISCRLAVLHFDWDNINAETIFAALESFLPPGKCLEKVTIYPSEYGMLRMGKELTEGPKEIWEPSSPDIDNEHHKSHLSGEDNSHLDDADEKKAWKQTSVAMRRRLRRYQLSRLKYFYAIAIFDSPESASAVYDACDGVEYGSTGIRFDLRFVDDAETFVVSPEWAHLISECVEVNKAKYIPRAFETPALHSTRITLSWDKTPAARTEWLREQFDPSNDPKTTLKENKKQLEEYVVFSSSGQSTAAPSDVDEPGPAPTVPRIRKHRPPRVAPEELRLRLLQEVSVNPSESDESEVHDEVEEVMDLNKDKSSAEESDQYDLTSGVGEQVSVKGKKVKRKCLPQEDDDSDLDFGDIENRLSDSDFEDEEGNKFKTKQRLIKKVQEDKKSAKKSKITQRKKILLKRKKLESNQEKMKDLWTGENEDDCRFDEFITNPSFGVSQLHRNYKEANEFLTFMRFRRTHKLQNQPT